MAGVVFRRIFVAGCAAVALAGCEGSDRDLVAVARTFPVPADWSELTEATAAEPVCVGAECKTVVHRWATAQRPTKDAVQGLMSDAGWESVDVNACEPRPNATGSFPFCRASAQSAGTDIELTVSGPHGGARPWNVTLRVR